MQTEPQAEPSSEVDVSEESSSTLTAGHILRQERERLGLNEKEVADQLHITMHYVKALESNSYEKLPGAVFARGYLKSYALLLGLDFEDILSRYDDFADKQKADSDEENRLLKARRQKDRNKPLVIVSLIVFVAGFVGLWLANSFFGEDAVSNVPSSADSSDAADNVRPALSRESQQLETLQPQLTLEVETDEVPTPTLVEESAPAIEQRVETVSQVDANIASGESAEINETPTVEILTSALQALREQQAAGVESVDLPRVISIEASGNDVLRISFSGESWVEVNDSDSEQIYRDIREAGDVLEITGSAPFSILLGDAPFTQMSLNGDEIDLSSNIRIDNSARLTVGL